MTHRLAALAILAAFGASPSLIAADASPQAGPSPRDPAPAAEPAEVPKPQPESRSEEMPATPDAGLAPTSERPVLEGASEAEATPDASPSQPEVAPEKTPAPVNGAFGIPLGERFEPCLVAKVIAQEEKTYRAADNTEQKGILYRVEPKVPNKHFANYAVETTRDGTIYSIRGDFEAEDKASRCDVTKGLAASLEEKYGKPRGKGGFGEWYSFRDMSVPVYKGVRLYANRCKRGIYSIHYSDDNARMSAPPVAPEPTETSGL